MLADQVSTYEGLPQASVSKMRPVFKGLINDVTYWDTPSKNGDELRKVIRQFSTDHKTGPQGIKGGVPTRYTLHHVAPTSIKISDLYNRYKCK